MANRLAYSIVLTLCLIRWSGSSAVPVSETTMEPIQREKQSEAPPLDELETVNGTEANVDDILSATAEPPVATTKSLPSLVVVLNPLLSPDGRTDATTSPAPVTTTPAEEIVIDSDVPATLNGTELDLENATESTTSALPWPPTPSSTAITTTSEVTPTVRTTYPDVESSAESFDSGESSSSYSSVSKSASDVPTEPSSFAQDKTLLPLSTTPLPIPPLWPWMLFILNGNATVANRRQRDLGTYLRLNLAARLDADYNDVAINRILLTPQAIVANISVEPSHLVYGGTGAAGLEALGQGNVTLLELSGHEFQVDRIIRFDEIVDQRGMMSSMEMSSMVTTVGSEVTVYGAVGAVFLFLLVALLLGLSFSSPCKSGDNGKYLSNNSSNLGYDRDQMDCNYSPDGFAEWGHSLSTMELMPTPPPVIYTEQLARDIEGDCVGLEQLLKKPSHFMSWSNSSSRSPLTTDHSSSTLAEFHHHQQQRYQNPDDSLYCHNHNASRS